MERRKYKIQPAEVWDKVRQDYLAGLGAKDVAEKYGVGVEALRARATREGWSRYMHAPEQPVDPPPPAPDLFDLSSEAEAGGDPAVLAESAAEASGRAMRAGRLAEARALAGLAETYRKLQARGETASGRMTVKTAPFQLVYDILTDRAATTDRMAISPGKPDPDLEMKRAYWEQQAELDRKYDEIGLSQAYRRKALDRRISALEAQLKAAGLEPAEEDERDYRIRMGTDMVINMRGKVVTAKEWSKSIQGL